MVYTIRSRNVTLGRKSMFKEEPQQPIDGIIFNFTIIT